MNAMEINRHMWDTYAGERVAVLYSAGLDSSILAHQLLHQFDCEVALLKFDPGPENHPGFRWHRPEERDDYVHDIEQFDRYARLLEEARTIDTPYRNWHVREPALNSIKVTPGNLLPPDNPSAVRDEAAHGLQFYSGIVMTKLTMALSIAAAQGYDHVVTGHMLWNEHYYDETLEFAQMVNDVFRHGYSGRIASIPQISMPYRDLRLTKADVIQWNNGTQMPLDPRLTISCNVCELVKDDDGAALSFKLDGGLQIHCGHCQHCLDRKVAFAEAGVQDTALFAQ